jgi:DHA1 family tetracycline resistance protein-like MFS transporter
MGIGLVYPLFSSMIFSAEPLLLPTETAEGTRSLYLGALLAAMSIAQFFSSPLLGSLSDQKGRKRVLILSLWVGIIGYALCMGAVLVGNVFLLIGSRLLIGLSAGNAAVVGASIADMSTPENKAKHFGWYAMMSGVGFTVGPFLGGILSSWGYEVPFLTAGVATLGSLLLVQRWFPETHTVTDSAPLTFCWHQGLRDLKKALRMPTLRLLFLAVLFFCFGWSFFYEFIPVSWIADYGFTTAQIGLYYAYGAGFFALSSGVLIRPIVTRYTPGNILFFAFLGLGLLLLFLLAARPPASWLFGYLPLVNFLCALGFSTYTAHVSNRTSKEAQGEVLGILQSIQAAAFALSPLAAGPALGPYPHLPLLVGGLCMCLAALCIRVSRAHH